MSPEKAAAFQSADSLENEEEVPKHERESDFRLEGARHGGIFQNPQPNQTKHYEAPRPNVR